MTEKIRLLRLTKMANIHLRGLAPGKYGLSVVTKGFDIVIKGDIVVAGEDDTTTLNIRLTAAARTVYDQIGGKYCDVDKIRKG